MPFLRDPSATKDRSIFDAHRRHTGNHSALFHTEYDGSKKQGTQGAL
jgi:hypothetical protein